MTDITNGNLNLENHNQPVVVLPKVMSAKTFNRIYGGHETLGGVYKLHQKLVAELLATLLFVFGVVSSNVYYGDSPICAILGSSAIGGVMIYIFGRVSGAHFNPAISLALLIRQKLSAMEFGLYVLAQIIGAFLACLLFVLVRRGKFNNFAGNEIGLLMYDIDGKDGWSYFGALIMEIILTFILIMFILASCEKDNYLGPSLGLAFSLVLLGCSVAGGMVSGCSMNPARSLAPAFMQWFDGTNKNPIKQIWIYLVGPFLGAIIAALVWPVFIFQ
jgi:aquaporin Z